MSDIGTSASYLRTAILTASNEAELDRVTDEWLDAHVAAEVVSMDLAVAASSYGDTLYLLIVYKGERRVRRA